MPISCVKVSNVNQAGKAEGEGIIVYPDKVTLLAAWFEDGKMVSTQNNQELLNFVHF